MSLHNPLMAAARAYGLKRDSLHAFPLGVQVDQFYLVFLRCGKSIWSVYFAKKVSDPFLLSIFHRLNRQNQPSN